MKQYPARALHFGAHRSKYCSHTIQGPQRGPGWRFPGKQYGRLRVDQVVLAAVMRPCSSSHSLHIGLERFVGFRPKRSDAHQFAQADGRLASNPPRIIWRVVLPRDSRQNRGRSAATACPANMAKRKLDSTALLRYRPPRRPNQPVQERQHALGGRRPGIVVLQVVRRLQPGCESALGMANDRLLGLREHPPLIQAVPLESPGVDVLDGAVPQGDVRDRVGNHPDAVRSGCLQGLIQPVGGPAIAHMRRQVRHRGRPAARRRCRGGPKVLGPVGR